MRPVEFVLLLSLVPAIGLVTSAAAAEAVAAGRTLPAVVTPGTNNLCAQGRRQSPVDIVETRKQDLPEIRYQYQPLPLRIVNDGHTVRVRMAGAGSLQLGRDHYLLQQFHFHVPGGDRIRGHEYPMAMHFVHKSRAGHLAVVVLLFNTGSANPVLARLLGKFPQPSAGEQRDQGFLVDAAQLLPESGGYYTYEGSLTGPPCTEGVTWIVLKQPAELSPDQLATLVASVPGHSRPVQPLYGRVVKESR